MEATFKKLQDSVSASSYKQYLGIYKKLKLDSPDDFRETEKIMKEITSKKTPNTQKNYLAAVVKLMRVAEMDDKHIKPFFDKMTEMIEETKPSPEWNEKQKANLMSLDEINKKRDDLIKGLTTFTSRENYDKLLNHMILSLYTLIPPRRNEYYNMEIIKTPAEVEDGKNYLLWGRKQKQFIFQLYKTSKKYGKQVEPIPEELEMVITNYLKHREKIALTSKKFLTKYGDLEIENSNEITRRLNSVLGKNIAASMLRHIFLTEKFGSVFDEMEDTAKQMAHSTSQQKDYVKQ